MSLNVYTEEHPLNQYTSPFRITISHDGSWKRYIATKSSFDRMIKYCKINLYLIWKCEHGASTSAQFSDTDMTTERRMELDQDFHSREY